jgi:hypothetical protein
MAGIVSEVVKDLFAATGWQNSLCRDFNAVSHSLGGLVDLIADSIDYISSCVENGGHGGLGGKRWEKEASTVVKSSDGWRRPEESGGR